MRRNLRVLLTIALSAFFLALAVRGAEWSAVRSAFLETNWAFVPAIFVTTLWTLYIRAQRWQLLLAALGRVERAPLVHATNIGFMANMILPLRAGEVIRPVLLSRKTSLPLGGVLASIVLERILDLLMVIALFGIAVLLVPVSPVLRSAGWALLGVAGLLCLGIAVARLGGAQIEHIWITFSAYLPNFCRRPIGEFVRGFLQAVKVLDRTSAFFRLAIWTVYLWAVIALVNALGILALALSVPLISAVLSVTALVALAVSAPSAPGYVGAFQLGCTLALSAFSVEQSTALAFSLVLHATQFVATVLAGVYSLTVEGLSLREIEEVGESNVAIS
jgi:uncharacterized protein (TIRG00374 family)